MQVVKEFDLKDWIRDNFEEYAGIEDRIADTVKSVFEDRESISETGLRDFIRFGLDIYDLSDLASFLNDISSFKDFDDVVNDILDDKLFYIYDSVVIVIR